MDSNPDTSHAAMCVYCGKAVIYDTRQVTDMESAHRQIVEHDQQCPKNPLVQQIHTYHDAVFSLFGYMSSHHPETCEDLNKVFAGSTWGEIAKKRDPLITFINEALDSSFEGCDLDGAWIHERCHQLNLVDYVPYDPDQHHVDCDAVEPGDMIYVRKPWLGIKSAEGDDG